MTSWKNSGRRWKLSAATAVTISDILKMSTGERAELAQALSTQFNLRMSSFRRAHTMGFAATKIMDDMKEVSDKLGIDMWPGMKVMSTRKGESTLTPEFAERRWAHNLLASYIVMMQDFFVAKSSTVSGWRDIGREQDIRIFGGIVTPVRSKNNYNMKVVPVYSMTDEERTTFWKVFREVYKAGWNDIVDYSSDSQRIMGTLWMNGKFDKTDFDTAYAKVTELLDDKPEFFPEHISPENGNNNDPFGNTVELDRGY